MDNRTLRKVFATVGRRYGYEEVSAEFSPFKDFKIKWVRAPKWIELEVCDYLQDTPEDVMASLAVTVYNRIREEGDLTYSEEVTGWLSSHEFISSKQPLYVRRYRGLSRSPRGRARDLADSYDRLVEGGLVERDPDVYIGWSPAARSRRAARASVLMKVVAVSDLLDDMSVPEDVLDYCLYTQLAHVGMGFDPRSQRREKEYDELLSRYPDRAGMEARLREMNIIVRGRRQKQGEVSPCANTPLHGPAVTPVSGH